MSLMRFYHTSPCRFIAGRRTPFTEFDRLFDDALAASFSFPSPISAIVRSGDLFHPRTDVHESKENNTVTAAFELPGMKPEDITIDLQENRLTVAGEARKSDSHEEDTYIVRERRYGKFSKTLQLPFATKPDDVKAKMENGILTVTFPKTNPEQHVQHIAIQ